MRLLSLCLGEGFHERGCQVKRVLLLQEGFVLLGIQPLSMTWTILKERKGFYERGCQVKTLLLLQEGFVFLGIQPLSMTWTLLKARALA
jgi:hypothetical protein